MICCVQHFTTEYVVSSTRHFVLKFHAEFILFYFLKYGTSTLYLFYFIFLK